MKKLTLEHLAPYLPYGLIMYYTGKHQKQFRGTKKREILTIENYQLLTFSTQRKPILRPLSDLTKEIEVNGNKIKLSNHGYWKSDHSTDIKQLKDITTASFGMQDQYNQLKLLLYHHFDIFGLIPKGLAIDINSLTSDL